MKEHFEHLLDRMPTGSVLYDKLHDASSEFCDAVSNWKPDSSEWPPKVLEALNRVRKALALSNSKEYNKIHE